METVNAIINFGQLMALITVAKLLVTIAQNQKAVSIQARDDVAATAASLRQADSKRQVTDPAGDQAVRTKQR